MATPTDPFWNLGNTYSFLPGIEVIWDDYSGQGVKVGVYDDGVEAGHEDLNDNYDTSLLIEDANGNLVDPSHTSSGERHGTPCAGIIAGEWNGVGGVGLAWGSSFGSVNIFSGYASTNYHDALEQGAGLYDVTSHSYGYYASFSQGLAITGSQVSNDIASIQVMVDTGRGGLGTSYVTSAGNDNWNASGTGVNSSHLTITVGALDDSGAGVGGAVAADFTNFGASLLVSAGGTSIVATDRSGSQGYDSSNYTFFGGTSAAAPIVSGVVTLMLEAEDGLGWRDVKSILAMSANHVGSELGNSSLGPEVGTWFENAATNWNGGGMTYHLSYGFGSVDVYGAVRMAEVWGDLYGSAQTSANEMTSSVTRGADLAINGGGTASRTMTITDNYVVESVEVTITLKNVPWILDLSISLVSADGTEIELIDFSDTDGDGNGYNSGLATGSWTWTFGVEGFRGEMSAGTWRVKINDSFNDGADGQLDSVTLDVFGTKSNKHDVYHYTSDYLDLLANDASRGVLEDTDGGTDWIDMSSIYFAGAGITDLVVSLARNGKGGVWDDTNGGMEQLLDIVRGTIIEKIALGDTNDTVTGNNKANHILGMRGDDTIDGGRRSDILEGGDGSDTLIGGSGSDRLEGNSGSDVLNGGSGNDYLAGGSNGDMLFGGNGDDELFGGGGADELYVSRGDDDYTGGSGRDVFIFDNASNFVGRDEANRIMDFGKNTDMIDFRGVDANTVLGGSQSFDFIGSSGFSGTAGELRVSTARNGDYRITGDLDGDGVRDFLITVKSFGDTLDAGDFIL